MGTFLRATRARHTLVYLPLVIPYDGGFEVVVSDEAREVGEVWIEVDGKRVVTIERDGTVRTTDPHGVDWKFDGVSS